MSGSLFVVTAPSGAGKTTLVHALLNINPHINLSVSYTTRQPRAGEVNGKDYHFVSRAQFLEMAARGEFLESAEVYGNLYGTSQTWITQEIAKGNDILLEIDWQGAAQVRKLFPECLSIFILPPSLEVLEQRLTGRGKDNAEVIAKRLAAAHEDVSHVAEFDYVIINDNLNEALRELNAVVLAARLRGSRQLARHQQLINQLQKPEN
ncbi:MAG: guanylate kinase [Sideroxydans sp.]|nr:guanylate kinase [Sideroxydans sp.]